MKNTMLLGLMLLNAAPVLACPTLIINDSQDVIGLSGYDIGDSLSSADFFEFVKAYDTTGVSLLLPMENSLVTPSDISFYVYVMQNDTSFAQTYKITFKYCTAGHDQVIMKLSDIKNGMLDEDRFDVEEYVYAEEE